MTLKPYTH